MRWESGWTLVSIDPRRSRRTSASIDFKDFYENRNKRERKWEKEEDEHSFWGKSIRMERKTEISQNFLSISLTHTFLPSHTHLKKEKKTQSFLWTFFFLLFSRTSLSHFSARCRAPYSESCSLHETYASSPSKKTICRVTANQEDIIKRRKQRQKLLEWEKRKEKERANSIFLLSAFCSFGGKRRRLVLYSLLFSFHLTVRIV